MEGEFIGGCVWQVAEMNGRLLGAEKEGSQMKSGNATV